MLEAFVGFVAMLSLMFLGVPIAFAMGLVGFLGLAYMRNLSAAWALAGSTVLETGAHYTLAVLPLFILMSNFAIRARLGSELFQVAYAFIGRFRGGLAMATIVACGGFSAICGSSLATAATMSKVAYPEMRRFGYSRSLAGGSIAAGGTLGILIPPSALMVIYCIMAQESVGRMFAAALLPGILAIFCYLGAVAWVAWRHPDEAPAGEPTSWGQRVRLLREIWGVIFLFGLVMGGIYLGVFTATEAAGVGAVVAFLFAVIRGGLRLRGISQVLAESARTTAMMLLVLMGATIFTHFINFTSLPRDLGSFVAGIDLHPMVIIFVVMLIYLVLGMFLESLSMILLTVPIFLPIAIQLGFDPIWFGIFVVVMTELSLITPPVGMNLFVLKALLPKISLKDLYHGVLPFVAADVIRVCLLILMPWIALWLPSALGVH